MWDETLRINVRGTFLATKHAVPYMIGRGGGSIINTSSGASLSGDIGHPAYGASKAAINALTMYTATEFGKQGIRANAVAPGLFPTEGAWERLYPPGSQIEPQELGVPLRRVGK